jgi:glycosyltransferase involved in cell wall biosynthesis
MTTTVSILTITQHSRFAHFTILYEIIKNQTYSNIIEWIIVEGSPILQEAIINKKNIHDFLLINQLSFHIKYIEYSGKKLGGLRNIGNFNCSGDIIVCFDDDDYYPPERISHSVEMLNKSNSLIGGVSNMYLYDLFYEILFQFHLLHKNHSTNNAFVYKKSYLLDNKYDDECNYGEEKAFTKDFTNSMIQLNPKKTIICISHNNNTFMKQDLCSDVLNKKKSYIKVINKNINKYIPNNILQQIKDLYILNN